MGFSKGCAAFTLKKPPPLVPSSLIAICDATGPVAMNCFPPSSVVAVTPASKFWTIPCQSMINAPMMLKGSNTYSVMRTRSDQKLPMDEDSLRAMPRTTAAHTAMPTAAETKF